MRRVRIRDDRLVKNEIGSNYSRITKIATFATWDNSKRFFFFFWFRRALEWKVIFISNDTSFVSRECACIYAFYNWIYFTPTRILYLILKLSHLFISWISTWWDTRRVIFFKNIKYKVNFYIIPLRIWINW